MEMQSDHRIQYCSLNSKAKCLYETVCVYVAGEIRDNKASKKCIETCLKRLTIQRCYKFVF
jgi:hypothetical protein